MSAPDLQIFYHVYQANNWLDVYLEQLNAIAISGLAAKAKMTIGLIGDAPLPYVLPNTEVIKHAHNNEETDTLKLVRDFAAVTDN